MSKIHLIKKSISPFEIYLKEGYQNAIDNLIAKADDKSEEDEKQLEYITNNLHTIETVLKTYEPSIAIKSITKTIQPIEVYIIMENWCGSSAGNIPYVVKIMNTITDVKIHIVPRDENDDFMNQYLSEGKKSIPIVIGFDVNGIELFKWGSSSVAQATYAKTLQKHSIPFPDFIIAMKKWFLEFNVEAIETDFISIFNSLSSANKK